MSKITHTNTKIVFSLWTKFNQKHLKYFFRAFMNKVHANFPLSLLNMLFFTFELRPRVQKTVNIDPLSIFPSTTIDLSYVRYVKWCKRCKLSHLSSRAAHLYLVYLLKYEPDLRKVLKGNSDNLLLPPFNFS